MEECLPNVQNQFSSIIYRTSTYLTEVENGLQFWFTQFTRLFKPDGILAFEQIQKNVVIFYLMFFFCFVFVCCKIDSVNEKNF